MSVDVYFDDVKLLLHFDGTDGSTIFTDTSKSEHTINVFGNAQIDTADSKFGGASALFDGTGDYLEVPASADFDFGTGDFTVEFWIKPNGAATGFHRILSSRNSKNLSGNFQIWYPNVTTFGDTVNAVSLANPTGNGITVSTLTACNDGNWHHIAFTRLSGTSRAFYDGVLKDSAADSNDYYRAGTEGIKVGARADLLSTTYYNGWLDDLRITKGVARYTASFSVPTTAFPDEYISNGQTGALSLTGNAPTSNHADTAEYVNAVTGALSLSSSYGYFTTDDVVLGDYGTLSISGNVGTFENSQTYVSYIDAAYDLNAYLADGFIPLSAHYDLNAYSDKRLSLTSEYNLLSYSNKVAYADSSYDLLAYQQTQTALDGAYDLSSYANVESLLNSQYDILAYSDKLIDLIGQYDLNAYAEKLFSINGQYDVASYKSYQTALNSEYDLLAYQNLNSYIDAQYSLKHYIAVTTYVQGEYDLGAYKTAIITVDAQYGLSAFQQIISYLQAEYNILANEAFYGWIMNLDTKAVSRYEGFSFNSLDGQFGAMSDGIYQLSGTTNNGTAIDAFIQTGRFDFGSQFQKRVEYAYLATKSSGDVQLSMTANGSTIDYTVSPDTEMNTVKKKLALGPKDRYWQAKISNMEGSTFELYSVELLESIQSRRYR
jgi:hypothetical protein